MLYMNHLVVHDWWISTSHDKWVSLILLSDKVFHANLPDRLFILLVHSLGSRYGFRIKEKTIITLWCRIKDFYARKEKDPK